MGLAHVVVLAFELVESLEFRRLVDVPNYDFPVYEMCLLQRWTSLIGSFVKCGRKSNNDAAA